MASMTQKLIPTNPSKVMVIRKITDNITTLSVPFLRFGRIRIGGRGTIVRLTTGSLAVFSPVAITPAVEETIKSLGGEVSYLIATDNEHHIFLSAWHAAYPKASIIGPEGLPEKRLADKSIPPEDQISFTTVFTATDKASIKISDEFDTDFKYEYVESHPNKELVFLHKPDKTIIVADYLFNLPATEQYSLTGEGPNAATKGLLTKLFIPFNSTKQGALWPKRFKWLLSGSAGQDGRTSWNKSARCIAGWEFDNIVPCHGDVILGQGKEIFEEAFIWHLQEEGKMD